MLKNNKTMNLLGDLYVRTLYSNLKLKSISTSTNFAILKLAITDETLKQKYEKKAGDHNKKILNNLFFDSGFDIILPQDTTFEGLDSVFVDFDIKAEMLYCDVTQDLVTNSPFLIHPRSSMSKLPLMLSNHTGIIDSGYRGNIIGAFRSFKPCDVEHDTRLLQICHPSLCPIFVVLVNETQLSSTERKTGGFGSTGIN